MREVEEVAADVWCALVRVVVLDGGVGADAVARGDDGAVDEGVDDLFTISTLDHLADNRRSRWRQRRRVARIEDHRGRWRGRWKWRGRRGGRVARGRDVGAAHGACEDEGSNAAVATDTPSATAASIAAPVGAPPRVKVAGVVAARACRADEVHHGGDEK